MKSGGGGLGGLGGGSGFGEGGITFVPLTHVPLTLVPLTLVHSADQSVNGNIATERFSTLASAAPKLVIFAVDKLSVMVTV